MKVFIFYENSGEKALAMNLSRVLEKIGQLLCYGKVIDGGVRVEDWQGKPQVKMDCTVMSAIPAGSISADSIALSPPYGPGYSAEFEYRDGGGYYGVMTPYQPPMSPPMSRNQARMSPPMSRNQARDLVAMFDRDYLDGTVNANGTPVKKPKPKVPKPNTTKTGVTIRAIDLDDDHEQD